MTITTQDWSLDPNEPGKILAGIEDINNCIYLVLTTVKGSDPYRPDFGCGIWNHLDKPINVAIPNMVQEIGIAIATYEPRAKVNKIVYKVFDLSNISFKVYWSSGYGDSSTNLTAKL